MPLALAQLAGTIETGDFDSLRTESEIDRVAEILSFVERIETAGEAASKCEVLFLVLTYGHEVGVMYKDIDSHERRISEEAGVDALVGLVADDLAFDTLLIVVIVGGGDTERLASFILERGCAH